MIKQRMIMDKLEIKLTSHRQRASQRIYVKVNSDFDATGSMQPRAIIWEDGRTFKIDAVQDFRPASTLAPGKNGDCYTVVIRGEVKHLYFQRTDPSLGSTVGRWWVECPA